MNGGPKIGVLLCACRPTMRERLDYDAITSYLSSLESVVHTEQHPLWCLKPGLSRLNEIIEEKGIDRLIVAGCSYRTHRRIFENALQEAGLNPYMLEIVNVRDHCAAVHPEGATERALDQIRMAITRAVELQPEQVPTIQKQIIYTSANQNKLVITATQMLETMSINPIPTRAEASDVANAIFDGTDAVMLSGETASGRYPIKALKMMAKIANQAEASPFMKYNLRFDPDPTDLITHAVAQSAVNILHEINAKCIVAFSVSGKTSKQISA